MRERHRAPGYLVRQRKVEMGRWTSLFVTPGDHDDEYAHREPIPSSHAPEMSKINKSVVYNFLTGVQVKGAFIKPLSPRRSRLARV